MAHIRPYRGKWRAEVQRHGIRTTKLVATEDEARLWAQHAEEAIDVQKRRYEPRESLVRNGADLVTMVPKIVLEAARVVPHRQVDVLEAAVPTRLSSGIYFLLRAGEVVYVGQSVDVLHRISRHRREGRKFDAYAIMECERDQLDTLERQYIMLFVPRGNLTLGKPDRSGRTQL